MKGFKITDIDCNEIEIEVELYFSDTETFDVERKEIWGDMGFAFCEQSETRNRNTLKENIDGIKWWAENIVNHEGIMNECIEILYLCKGTFVDYVYANEYDERYDDDNVKISKTKATELVRKYLKEDFSPYTATEVGDTAQIYALALCSPKVGKKLNLEKYVGMKVHYYDPIKVSENFADVQNNFLKLA